MPRDLFQERPRAPRDLLAGADEPMVNMGALTDTLRDMPRYAGQALNSFATGAMDLPVGAGQLVSNVVPDAVLRPLAVGADYLAGGSGDVRGPMAERYSDAMRERERQYQESRDNPEMPDVGRFTGSVVAGSVAGAGPAAATLPGRMIQGAKIGSSLGMVQPVGVGETPEQDPGYWGSKAVQVGGGAALGFLAPAAVEGLIRGVGATVNALTSGTKGLATTLRGGANPVTIERTIGGEMERQGVNWTQLPQAVRASLVAEVQKSLKAGGKLDPEAIRRLADFQRLNMQPTQGQLSRDPLQFAREQNYARTEIGQPIAQRLNEQNRQLVGTLDDVRGNIGAQGADPYAAGQRVISGLRAQDAARKGAVDTAYTQARNLAGIEADVPPQLVAQRLGQIIEEFGDDKIPGAVMKRLNEFGFMGNIQAGMHGGIKISGNQTRVFNIREAEKLKTLIGNNIDNPNTPTGKALIELRKSVENAINSIGDDAGSVAAGAFREARGLAAQRFQTLERAPGMANAISRDVTAPEKFLESYILRGEIQDVANLLRQMRPQDRAEVRAAVLDWIRARAVSGVEDTAKFSQAGVNKALQSIGSRKLELIFAGDRQALQQLQALARVGAYVQAPPVASGVNYSGSGTTLIDFADQATRVPLVSLLGRPGDIIRAQQVARSVAPATPTRPALPFIKPETLNAAAQRAAAVAALSAAPATSAAMGDRNKRAAMARALTANR